MNEELKFVYDLLSERKLKVEKKLTRNVTIQLVVILVGLGYSFKFAELASLIEEHLKIDELLVIVSVPCFLLYLIIEFGYSIGQYFYLLKFFKEEHTEIVKNYCEINKKVGVNDLVISLNPLNIFSELVGGKGSDQGKTQTIISRSLIICLVLLNNYTIFKMIETLLRKDKCILLIFNLFWIDCSWLEFIAKILFGGILVFFYYQYWSSNRKANYSPSHTTITVLILAFLIIFYFIFIRMI